MAMRGTTKTVTLSIPTDMMWKVKELMREEGMTRSEIFREALRRYIDDKEWRKIYLYGEMKAKAREITEYQVEDIIDVHRMHTPWQVKNEEIDEFVETQYINRSRF